MTETYRKPACNARQAVVGDTADATPQLGAITADMLNHGTRVQFVAGGSSMCPTIHDGDLLTVTPVRGANISLGSVVLYQRPGGLTAHRVLASAQHDGERVLYVRGDASRASLDAVALSDVLGLVTHVRRAGIEHRIDNAAWRVLGLLRANAGTLRVRFGRLLRRFRMPQGT